VIAIVGRPNVGKSTLLNAVVGRRIAIEDPTPGTTRDRVAVATRYKSVPLLMVDTGGITDPAGSPIATAVRHQVDVALAEADAIVFLVDSREGRAPVDTEIAALLRKSRKPVVIGVSKVDAPRWEASVADFYELGFGEPVPVSAKQRFGLTTLLDRVLAALPEELRAARPAEVGALPPMKLAIVGRQNVGKSTLVNHLAGEERVIVSEIPGTTRDSVDVTFSWKGREFIAIDTAGLRKKGKIIDPIEYHSRQRTEASIQRADVVLFLIDAGVRVTEVDKKIAIAVDELAKPTVLGINKYDLVQARGKDRTGSNPEVLLQARGNGPVGIDQYAKYVSRTLPTLCYAPISLLSALRGLNVFQTVEIALDLYRQAHERIPTKQLNDVVERAKAWPGPRARNRGRAKIFYGTQVGVGPPHIMLFVNDPELFPMDYRRNLANKFRAEMHYPEIPIKLEFSRGHRLRTRPGTRPTKNSEESK